MVLLPGVAFSQSGTIELDPVVITGAPAGEDEDGARSPENEAGTVAAEGEDGARAAAGAVGRAGGTGNRDAAQQVEDRRTIVAQDSSVGDKMGTPILDTPASVSVVTQRELEQRGVESLDAALAYTSGVATEIYGTDNRYDFYLIRGFYQTGTGTYQDGLAMRIPGFTASRVEPYGLSRIEVLKGSTSTLFGLNAPGGLVNLVTKMPLPERFGEVYSTIGSDMHGEVGTDFGGPIDPEGQFLYRFTAKGQLADDGLDELDDDRIYLAPALTWQPTDMTAITLLASYNKRDGNPGYGTPRGADISIDTYLGEPSFNDFDTEEYSIGYLARHDFGNGLQVRQNLRYTDLDLTYETVYGASADPSVPRSLYGVYGDSWRFGVDTQLQYDTSWRFFDSRTLAGIDYYTDEANEYRVFAQVPGIDIENPVFCGPGCLDPLPPGYDWDFRSSAVGVYAQEELTFFDKMIVTFGGRYDNVRTWVDYPTYDLSFDSSDEAWTGRAGVTYKVREDLAVYANYSESFQPVSADLGVPGTADPQEGTQYEVGIKYSPDFLGNSLFTLAAFDITQTNVPYNVTQTTLAQIGEVRVRGIEFEGKVALNEQLNAILAYSYWDPEIIEDGIAGNEGNRPERVPNHIGSAWLDYTFLAPWDRGNITVGAGVRYIGPVYADVANTIELNERTFVDAALTYRPSENVVAQLNVTNLFDEREVVNVDTFTNNDYYNEGRKILATVKLTW